MKNPNGFGSVFKLSGNRRNPWCARKTIGWNDKGHPIYQVIGYYPKREEAMIALAEFNKDPYDLHTATITFTEVYEKWSEKKYEEISRSNANGYRAAYKLCSDIYDIRFVDLKLFHLQRIVDASDKNAPTLKKLKILFNQLFDYAVMNEIIGKDKHIVEYLNVGKEERSQKHYRFTSTEIETMWRWAPDNEYIQLMLMLIYSGVRPGELFAVEKVCVNLEEKWFYIAKGKNKNAARKVPIHDKVFPFFVHWMQRNGSKYLITQLNGREFRFDTNHGQYTETYWKPLLTDMGILQYKNDIGETKDHTPDDTRHTFTTMWKEARLDEAMRRKIQGHSGKGIGEIVYTHYEFEKLREELNKL